MDVVPVELGITTQHFEIQSYQPVLRCNVFTANDHSNEKAIIVPTK